MEKQAGNETSWNKQAEKHQIEWRRHNVPKEVLWGKQNNVTREHILPAEDWLLGIWEPIRSDLDRYIQVSGIQPNTGKHNLKSSWAQCANLFFPFRNNPTINYMLASFLKEQLSLSVNTIESLELEYAAPGNLEPKRLLGETNGKRGSNQTSPDVAIVFGCEDGKSGIYLIENKYTEHSFYNCSGAKKTVGKYGLEPNKNPERCQHIARIIDNFDNECQQNSWGRKYWKQLALVLNRQELVRSRECPALKGGYQLFRQQALAQGIENYHLFDYVISGVAYDDRNKGDTELITCLNGIGINDFTKGWAGLFNTNVFFHCFTHQNLVSWIRRSRNKDIQNWATYISERYNCMTNHDTGSLKC